MTPADPGSLLSPRTRHAIRLFAGVPRSYDRMSRLLSLGLDPLWRRFLVSRVTVPPAGLVLDVATGTGAVALEVAARTDASIVGLDQSEPMLRRGVKRATEAGSSARVNFVLGRAERLPFADERFDAVSFTYLLRYVDDPAATLAELARVVKPGGTLASLEFHVPGNPVWRALWFVHTRVGLPVAGRLVSSSWYRAGRFLGPSISSFYRRHPVGDQLAMWREAGLATVRTRVMSLGAAVVTWGTKRAR
ncbi:MAG: ubiquinone/menaquinone biosynthesis methyltransferase [Actinomycetota bacterium]